MKIKIDIEKKYGKLKILGFAMRKNNATFVNTLCDCGNEKIINFSNIKQGKIRSCGCLQKEILFKRNAKDIKIGSVFGRLKVISFHGKHVKYNHLLWLCKCNCGKETIVSGRNLRTGKTKSCRCYRYDRAKEACFTDLTGKKKLAHGEASFNALFKNLKNTAHERNYCWELNNHNYYVFYLSILLILSSLFHKHIENYVLKNKKLALCA